MTDLFRAPKDGRGARWAAVAWGHACWRRARPLQRLQKLSIEHREPGVAAGKTQTHSDTLTQTEIDT